MMAKEVNQIKALAMYYAVVAFGPRWGPRDLNRLVCTQQNDKITCGVITVNAVERVDIPTTQEDLEDVRTIERQLELDGGSLRSPGEIEQLALKKGNPRFPRELRR